MDAEADVDPVDLPLADDAFLGPDELLRNDAKEIAWRSPLRLAHLVDGWFPLHPHVARELRWSHGPRLTSHLELGHADRILVEREAAQDVIAELGVEPGRLTGIHWPRDFFPGLMLELRWLRGETVIRVATTPLLEPLHVSDRVIGHCYDPRVLTREDAPGSHRHGDSAAGLGPRQLVMRTVRREIGRAHV